MRHWPSAKLGGHVIDAWVKAVLPCVVCMVCLMSLVASAEDQEARITPLAAAQRVAETRFPDFAYGHNAAKKQVDCVQFLQAVLEDLLARDLTEAESDAVLIDYRFDDLGSAVVGRDPRTKGVVRAIAETIACGREIRVSDVAPGDFVQYWYKSRSGKWLGHASVVSRVWRPQEGDIRVAIFGSHKSKNRICENDFGGDGLCITKVGRVVYVARFEPPRQSGDTLRIR
jgi:hypothetical protein